MASAGPQEQPKVLDYLDQRDPVVRFQDLPFESQLHDPLMVLDDVSASLTPSMSMDANQPFKFFFSRVSLGRNGGDDRAMYSVMERPNGLAIYTIHPSSSSKVTWKRTVYAATSTPSPDGSPEALFNIKKSIFNPPTYSAFRGSRSGQDLDPSNPYANTPFLRLKANEIGRFPHHYKFYGTVKSLRAPTGNSAVDSVLAVERETKLVVLGSSQMRDIFVFLELGTRDGSEWKFKNQYAPGPLIATARAKTVGSVNSAFLGPDVMEVEVAPGVDGRLILAIVLSAITHLQVLHIGVNGTGVAA